MFHHLKKKEKKQTAKKKKTTDFGILREKGEKMEFVYNKNTKKQQQKKARKRHSFVTLSETTCSRSTTCQHRRIHELLA